MKFTFIGESVKPPCETYHTRGSFELPTKTTLEFEAEDVDIVVLQLKPFLQGCGYKIDGEIAYKEPEDVSPGTETTDGLREELHRKAGK